MSNHVDHVEQKFEHEKILLAIAEVLALVVEVDNKIDKVCKAHKEHHEHHGHHHGHHHNK